MTFDTSGTGGSGVELSIADVSRMSIEERAREGLGPSFEAGPGRDPEVVAEGISDPTPAEERGMAELSDVDLQIFAHKMDSITDEGRFVFERLAMAPALQIGDVCTAVFTASGDMCSVATGIYFHAILNYGPIKYVRKHYMGDSSVGVEPGDVFFFNEALAGAVHPYDMFTFMPVFHDDELIAWVTCGGHQGESGAKGPGGFTPDAKSRYEEGFHAPAFKIGEDFELKTDKMDFLANSVRNPRTFSMDQRTRLAVCMRQRKRLKEEVERRGVDAVVGGMRGMIERDIESAKERLTEFNDGVYRHVSFLDTIGTDDGLVRVPVELRKRDDELLIDMTGTSPEHLQGPFHSYWHFVRGTMAVFLFPFVFDGLHKSMGLMEPITIKVPPGCLYNTDDPEIAHGQTTFMGRIATLTGHQACMKMMYDSDYAEMVTTTKSANISFPLFQGKDQYGYPIAGIPAETNAAGGGARHDMDGVDSIGFYWSPVVDCMSVEQVERRFPFLYLFYDALDSERHGYGKYRGGQGVASALKPHNVDAIEATSVGIGERFSLDFGLFGGYSGPTTPRFGVLDSNVEELLAETSDDLPTDFEEITNERPMEGEHVNLSQTTTLNEYTSDDVMTMWMSSGGGYGDVLERDPVAVMNDVEQGYLTHETARKVYRVDFDEETLAVDEDATERLRDRERAERLEEAEPFESFIEEWSDKRPKEALLEYYGEWPIPAP